MKPAVAVLLAVSALVVSVDVDARTTDVGMAQAMAQRVARRCATIWIQEQRCPTTFAELGLPTLMQDAVPKTWRFACHGEDVCIAFDTGDDLDSSEDDTVAVNVGGDTRWHALGERRSTWCASPANGAANAETD